MNPTQWRLTLDAPAPFATEAGHIRTAQCADFRAASDAPPSGTFRDPQTGIVMLTPSILSPGFVADFKALDQWTVQSAFWREHRRAVDQSGGYAPLLGTVKPAGSNPTLITLLTVTAILAVINEGPGDTLVWAAESLFALGADEGFAVHYHGLMDEMLRQHNWFAVQWGGLLVHLDANGILRLYTYPGGDETQNPVLFDQFNLSSPGEIYNRPGYFWFLPVPGIGLLIYHSLTSQFLGARASNANAGAARGYLARLPSALAGGVNSMLPAGNVRLALNPNLDHLLGFQVLSFPGGGTYTDDVFDPGYPPSHAPSQVTQTVLPTAQTAVTATLRKADNSGAWSVGDQQGRVQLALSTTDSRYTPFAYGYQVQWAPILASRAPAPLVIGWTADGPDRLTHLEFAEDEYLRFEGSVGLILGSAHGRQIAERGDATFLLEKSLDGGATWITHNGGLAKQNPGARMEMAVNGEGSIVACWYDAAWTLSDLLARVDEIHETKTFATDGLSIGDALNAALVTSGFLPIASLPAVATTVLLPAVKGDSQYSFAPRVGDSGSKILQMFLLFLRGYNPAGGTPREYRLRYDWPSQAWVCEAKPYDLTNAFTLTAFSDEETADQKTIRWETLELTVQPPEFNKLVVKGVTGTSANEAEIVQSVPVVNAASLGDATSVDYLGRLVTAEFHALALSGQGDVDAMACRIFDAAAHRRLQPKTTTPYWVDSLTPLAYMTIRAVDPTGARAALFSGLWVKRRSLMIDQDGIETMTLEMDSQWLGELEV